jgi:hypothetical protein
MKLSDKGGFFVSLKKIKEASTPPLSEKKAFESSYFLERLYGIVGEKGRGFFLLLEWRVSLLLGRPASTRHSFCERSILFRIMSF